MIPKSHQAAVDQVRVHLLPVRTRVPLKFGTETLTEVECLRVRVGIRGGDGQRAEGWGETPLSVQWVWPGALPYGPRLDRMRDFCCRIASRWAGFGQCGHPMEVSQDFQEQVLPLILEEANREMPLAEPMPLLAALVCFSAFDIALHDAYGHLVGRPSFETLTPEFLGRDLAGFLEGDPALAGKFPSDFLLPQRRDRMRAWHLVGGLDWLDAGEGGESPDAHPLRLVDWVERDGLQCLKIKLRGNDAAWDLDRLKKVGELGLARGVFQAERQLGRRIVQGVTQHQGRDLGGGQPRVGQCKGQSRCGLVDGEGFVGAEGRSVASEVGLLKRDIVLALA
ncbi:MAG: hypothetical protein RLZZ253_3342 [Verrucomicrobiota bacterium]